MAFHPYLFFGGNCREAFTRYHEIFGGDLQLMTMKDAPESENLPADKADMIIHGALMFGDNLLMASDDPMSESFGPVQGMMVSYDAADVDEAKRVFEALAEGGTVTQAIDGDVLLPGVRNGHRPLRHAVDGRRRPGDRDLTQELQFKPATISPCDGKPHELRKPAPARPPCRRFPGGRPGCPSSRRTVTPGRARCRRR